MAKGAALRCDELAVGPVAWRAAASIADAACVDLTPPPRCRWLKIFAHDANEPRETDAAMLRLDVNAVRMDRLDVNAVRMDPVARSTELRLRAALLPVHLRLDQHALRFFQSFASRGERVKDADDDSDDEAIVDADPVTDATAAFFQLAEIRVPSVRLDYVPRDVDVAA